MGSQRIRHNWATDLIWSGEGKKKKGRPPYGQYMGSLIEGSLIIFLNLFLTGTKDTRRCRISFEGDPGVRNADGEGHQNYLRNFFRIHTSPSPPFQYSWGGKKEKKVLVAQSCSTLCDPTEYSPQGSPDQGISQAIILEWVAISTSRGSSLPRDWTWVSHIVDRCFTVWATREVHNVSGPYLINWRHE